MWIKYVIFAILIGMRYGFVLISSAAGPSDVNLFPDGVRTFYQMHSTVLFDEISASSKNVGFFITGEVIVDGIGEHGGDRILKIELKALQLHIQSRKSPTPEGFVQHSSKLDSFPMRPVYVTWHQGKIGKVFLPKKGPISAANLYKGIASLFQFQTLEIETNETDASGFCQINYHVVESNRLEKTKTNCYTMDLPQTKSEDPILKVQVTSKSKVTYDFDSKVSRINHIFAKETHTMSTIVQENSGSLVETDQVLKFVKTEQLSGSKQTIPNVLEEISNEYVEDTLILHREHLPKDVQKLGNIINELKEHLASKHLGTTKSAKAFLRVLQVARKASKEEIIKVITTKKNQKILPQLYDVFGYIQNPDIHFAIMKKLYFDREDHLDYSERYLWSLSLAPHPNIEILQDLIERHRKNDNFLEKVKETLILSIAAMAKSINQRKVIRNVEEIIINNLNYAKEDDRLVYLRALKNLQSVTSIPLLLKTINEGTSKEGILAYKTLKSFDAQNWDETVLKTARRTFLQLLRKYDSSSRTLAIDLLLESNPNDSLLNDLLHYLKTNDTSFEVKQYVMQRLQMLSTEDKMFNERLSAILTADPALNNYEVLSPKGLSTALKRYFLKNSNTNGSLLTIQEIQEGIVKRGVVNVMLNSKEMFSLGIFAGGLGSFMGGGNEEEEEETATAGMELTLLDRQIRPFVFFAGQGELMGHVWSGTASERTTAFQSLVLLQDHLEYVSLGSGFIAEFSLMTGMSFDLSGNIEISIWSRTADSLVEKTAGIITNGSITLDTEFVRSQIEFMTSIEPKLNLKSDVDFSGKTQLCMRVTQPDSHFGHNVFKIERIPGSKHKMRIAKYKKSVVPGTTYSLNRKNNEMCSAMLS